MEGTLFYDGSRPDIIFSDGTTYGGLHCGDCFFCITEAEWEPVRLERLDDWVLWGQNGVRAINYGIRVKMHT